MVIGGQVVAGVGLSCMPEPPNPHTSVTEYFTD